MTKAKDGSALWAAPEPRVGDLRIVQVDRLNHLGEPFTMFLVEELTARWFGKPLWVECQRSGWDCNLDLVFDSLDSAKEYVRKNGSVAQIARIQVWP